MVIEATRTGGSPSSINVLLRAAVLLLAESMISTSIYLFPLESQTNEVGILATREFSVIEAIEEITLELYLNFAVKGFASPSQLKESPTHPEAFR